MKDKIKKEKQFNFVTGGMFEETNQVSEEDIQWAKEVMKSLERTHGCAFGKCAGCCAQVPDWPGGYCQNCINRARKILEQEKELC